MQSDPQLAAKLGTPFAKVTASVGTSKQETQSTKVEHEIVKHAQQIVSDFQIAALNRVVEMLGKHGFVDEQQQYYLLIDNLDKNWMPDGDLYLDLIKSLLFTVYELNRKLHGVKIIVALRDNIYHRIFEKTGKHGQKGDSLN